MRSFRYSAVAASFVAHAAALTYLVYGLPAAESGAKFEAPPTIEVMMPPMTAAAASPVNPSEAKPVEAKPVEATPPEPEVAAEPAPEVPPVLPVVAEAVEAVDPVAAVATEPEKPRPQKPKPRREAERPRKPAPPVETASAAPPAPPAPPAPVPSLASAGPAATPGGGNPGARADYRAVIANWVERHKRYPDSVRRRHLEGVPVVRFQIGRDGTVVMCEVVRSSGRPEIDDAALATIRRADPFPEMPEGVDGASMTFTVPIEFVLRG